MHNKNKTSKNKRSAVSNQVNIELTRPLNHLASKSHLWLEMLQDILALELLLSNISHRFRMRPSAKITSRIEEWRLHLLQGFNSNRCISCTSLPKLIQLVHYLKGHYQTSMRSTLLDQTRIE